MTLSRLWLSALLILGCKAADPAPVGEPLVTAPPASATAPATRATVPPPSASAPTPSATDPFAGYPLITDEECVARGGQIVTEKTYAHMRRRPLAPGEVVRPFKICRFPSPENGKACASSRECGNGRCLCTGDLARPDPARNPALAGRDGSAAVGICSDKPLASGAWWCLVEDGKATFHGIIID